MTCSDSDLRLAIERLRVGLDIRSSDTTRQELYEHWVSVEQWPLATVALPLIVGCDPEAWDRHVAKRSLSRDAARISQAMSAAFDCPAESNVDAQALNAWARREGIELPTALQAIFDFVGTVLGAPSTVDESDHANAFAAADERERLLGAALALVTKFPDQCRDPNGFFDGQRITRLIKEKGAVWFPAGPPSLNDDEIAGLLERYLT